MTRPSSFARPRSPFAAATIAAAITALTSTGAAATEPRACEDGQSGFIYGSVWPDVDAIDVPIDGVVVVTGSSSDGSAPSVTVEHDGVELKGEVENVGPEVFVWRGEPFEPSTTYHVATIDDPAGFSFTTGTALAPAPMAATAEALVLKEVEHEITECVNQVGSCCTETRHLGTETRMTANVTLSPAPAPFMRFNRAVVALAPDPDSFGADFTREQLWNTNVIVDLGLAGTWPGDQVCARVTVLDPLGRRVDGAPVCTPLSAIEEAPDPSGQGCDCAAAPPSTLLWLALLPLLRPRRRARRPTW